MKPNSPKLYLALILLGISISSCKPEVPSSSKISILDNPVCSPPCWQNIVPGKTNRDELLTTLASLDNFDQSSIVQQDYPNKEEYNHYIHGNLYLDPNAVTLVSVYLSDETVVELNFLGNWNLTLEDVIEEFGEPEGLSIYYSEHALIHFLFPSKGVAFRFDTTQWGHLSITPEMKIASIDYFSPDYYSEMLGEGWFSEGSWDYQESMAHIKPWKGYGKIEELYK